MPTPCQQGRECASVINFDQHQNRCLQAACNLDKATAWLGPCAVRDRRNKEKSSTTSSVLSPGLACDLFVLMSRAWQLPRSVVGERNSARNILSASRAVGLSRQAEGGKNLRAKNRKRNVHILQNVRVEQHNTACALPSCRWCSACADASFMLSSKSINTQQLKCQNSEDECCLARAFHLTHRAARAGNADDDRQTESVSPPSSTKSKHCNGHAKTHRNGTTMLYTHQSTRRR